MSQPNTSPSSPAAAVTKVSKWHLHRRMYDWTLSFARTRHATAALAFISFSESIWFPIPPDVLQIALTLEQPRKAWWYATVNTVSSVLGGITGYYIGHFGLSVAHNAFVSLGWQRVADFCRVETFAPLRQYADSLFMLTAGAVAIHPYKIFTIGAGVLDVALASFVLASIIGRGPRFFIIAALLYFFGERAKTFIDKYFNLITLVVTLALIAAVAWIVLHKR
ncbi:MAG: DedA family protein [Planctomycetota bacterium]|nr:DedA family protein [Planctomycetota bacterium]